mgnify:FL=1
MASVSVYAQKSGFKKEKKSVLPKNIQQVKAKHTQF